jgi:ubiquinone/menaquinone biosynthesis C-methylase UbiE
MSETLRQEFNQWALDGRGAELELHHRSFVEQTIPLMELQPRDRILEIGCGEGWASRWLAALAPECVVVGLDVSDEMIRNARAKSASHENLLFVWGSAEQIPWQENYFTKALCVESFYYLENPERALREIHRVLAPGGSLWIVNHLSQENDLSLRWLPHLKVPVQVRSAEEYGALFERCGFERFRHRMLPDQTPISADHNRPGSLTSPEELRRFRELGALLLSAHKPE